MDERSKPDSPMAHFLDGELSRLETEWPALMQKVPPLPAFTWEEYLEGLLAEAPTPVEELVIRGAMAALVKMAPFKPPEMILRELLVLTSSAFALADGRRSDSVPGVEMI